MQSSQNGNKRNTSNTRRRTSQSYRTNGSYQHRRGKKRRGPQYGVTRILLAVLIAAAAVICVMAAVKLFGSKSKETDVNTTTVSETDLQKEVMVEGVSITGMSREKAREAIDQKLMWGMKVTYHDEEYKLNNFMDSKIDSLLDEIYSGEPKENYTLNTDGLDEKVKEEVKSMAKKWDVPAKNGEISKFDKSTGQFVYTDEKNGFMIDQDQLVSDILAQMNAKNYKAEIPAKGREVAPDITKSQAKEMYQLLGTYTTTTTANRDRNKNIELASIALDGMILQPGEEFSFNKATGERSPAKGYRPAGAYLNGELIEEPGGGVCQVSSTLYNAVVFSGLNTTERHAHSYEPSYVTPGEDAMVSFGGPDMKFENNSKNAIAIRTSFSKRKLKISIIGIPILEKGVTLSMTSKKTAELDAPAPIYEEDQTLQLEEEKIVKAEKKGSRWVTNLVTKKDGVVVSDEFFHNSTYRGKPATIKRNTSGVVIPTVDPEETTTVPGQIDPTDDSNPNSSQTNPSTNAEPDGPGQQQTQKSPESTNHPNEPNEPNSQDSTNQGPGVSSDADRQNVVPPNPFGQ